MPFKEFAMRSGGGKVPGTVAAIAIGCIAVPGALAATPSTTAASWHLAYRAPAHYEIQGITAPARNDAWAYGSVYGKRNALLRSFYLHWVGGSWRQVTIRAARGFVPTAIAASSPSNVWLFGYHVGLPYGGVALAFNGHRWTAIGGPWSASTEQGSAVTATDVWLQAGCLAPGCVATLEHWTGFGWQSYVVPALGSLVGGGSRPWLVGVKGSATARHVAVYRWNGTSWQQLRAPAGTAQEAVGVASPGGRLWLVVQRRHAGPWRLYQRHGTMWSNLGVLRRFPAPDVGQPGLVYDGRNGFWALPFRWTGSRWVNTAPGLLAHPPRPRWLNSFWYNYIAQVPGSSAVWAVVLANSLPYTSGTVQSGIAWYGSKP